MSNLYIKNIYLLNYGVVNQWNASLVKLAIFMFVNQLLHILENGGPTMRANK